MTVSCSTFDSLQPGPHLVILAGVHGDEFEPILTLHQLVQEFQAASPRNPLLRGRLTLVPTANPSACQLGTRCGSDGLDMARTFPGTADGSPTQQAAQELTDLISSADMLIDLHTGGTELTVAPLCGYMLHTAFAVLEQQRVMARAMNLPIIWGTTPDLEGRSLSVARDANVPAVYCEYQGAATCTAAGIHDYVHGCLNVMARFDMIERSLPPDRIRHLVEDNSNSSGHLQICNPSPTDGIFLATVQLGQVVRVGDIVGMLTHLESGQQQTICTQQSGIVLVLRTFPRVLKGQSLFVILHCDSSAE